jgi:hypothetical protein
VNLRKDHYHVIYPVMLPRELYKPTPRTLSCCFRRAPKCARRELKKNNLRVLLRNPSE